MSDSSPTASETPSSTTATDTATDTATEGSNPVSPPEASPAFGWNTYAERTNGRFAMVGFAALLLLELFTRQDFWTWIGL